MKSNLIIIGSTIGFLLFVSALFHNNSYYNYSPFDAVTGATKHNKKKKQKEHLKKQKDNSKLLN